MNFFTHRKLSFRFTHYVLPLSLYQSSLITVDTLVVVVVLIMRVSSVSTFPLLPLGLPFVLLLFRGKVNYSSKQMEQMEQIMQLTWSDTAIRIEKILFWFQFPTLS